MENIIEFQKARIETLEKELERIEALEKELERCKRLIEDTDKMIKDFKVEFEQVK